MDAHYTHFPNLGFTAPIVIFWLTPCHVALHESDHISFKKPFENLILIPGSGHIELNMGRKVLNLLWVPLLCRIAQMLGFQTEKALAIVKSRIGHHHTGQILCACLYALSKELLVPFV